MPLYEVDLERYMVQTATAVVRAEDDISAYFLATEMSQEGELYWHDDGIGYDEEVVWVRRVYPDPEGEEGDPPRIVTMGGGYEDMVLLGCGRLPGMEG